MHDGIAQMFQIIEYARMMVGTKAIATLSTGYLNALEYAKTRVQGADLTQSTDKTAPRVTITHHPDVRRSLMTQKAYAEGMRALVLYTAVVQDAIAVKEAAGEDASADDALNDLLLPIVKGYGSEQSYELLGSESLQTFGGSGYLQDYPLEQYVRDAKIDTLYEGTTAIQGLDLFFRKIVRDQGQALTVLRRRRSRSSPRSEAGNGRARRPSGTCSPRRSRTSRGSSARWSGSLTARRRPTRATSTRSARTPRGCSSRSATWSSAGCCCARPRSRSAALASRDRTRGTRRSTRARSRPRQFFARQVLPQLSAAAGDRRGHGQRPDGPARRRLLTVSAGERPETAQGSRTAVAAADVLRVRIPLGHPRGRRTALSLASLALAALTTYLLLDRNHAEELGGGTRIAFDVLRGEQHLPLALMLALLGTAVAASLRGRHLPVGIGARRA